jgi:hypothetical protein
VPMPGDGVMTMFLWTGDIPPSSVWVAGLDEPACHRVVRLQDPERLEIQFAWP